MTTRYDEDNLVQRTTAEHLSEVLGWETIYAKHEKKEGDPLLGRKDHGEVVLERYLRPKLKALNPGLPQKAYDEAVRKLKERPSAQTLLQINRDKHKLMREGVPVSYRDEDGNEQQPRLQVFDFDTPTNNHFLAVRELWVKGHPYRRRADLVGYVNGLPLLFMEMKNLNRKVKAAYEENFSDYKDTVPRLFHHNAFVVLANGDDARIGALSSPFRFFRQWKRLAEDEPGRVNMETLLNGTCAKEDLLRLFEHFILFDDSTGSLVKILAQNQQYLGVLNAVEAVCNRKERDGKLGVFWHTQGSGKSYSMVFFTRMIHRSMGSHFTFVICTDRQDLDSQIYKTFAGCGLVDNDRDPCRAASGEHLEMLLSQQKKHVFTLIQKFNQEIGPEDEPYSERDDVIVITDEAHRTQYGLLALNMRNALPNASYMGFTGTPLFEDDEMTRRVFGEYVSTYDFQRAVEDDATVPLYYDARGDKLHVTTDQLNEKIADKLEELEVEDQDVAERLERALGRDYHIITADDRLDQIAEDFVQHYSKRWETGKAMFICIDKVTCVRMYNLIAQYWDERIEELKAELGEATDEQDELQRRRQIAWMEETRQAVVVSEEQGEVEQFRKWDLDIKPHRRLLKEGFETDDGQRLDVESAYKRADHPFRIAIVCAMWLTGFDVPSLSTLYLDKPMRAHTLMQAIARANRLHEGKENGLIVDYCGILKNLREALATFAGHRGEDPPEEMDPVRPKEELLEELEEAIALARAFLEERGARLSDITESTGFARNKAIMQAKEAANQNDDDRKRFEILARSVIQRFKACVGVTDLAPYQASFNAVKIVYKSLRDDREKADISDILQELHEVVDDSIEPDPERAKEKSEAYDISGIDFDRLQTEFRKIPDKNTKVQNLRHAVEQQLEVMIQKNPLRTNFQERYEEIVAEYNEQKERVTIEQTFEELLRFVGDLDEEQNRAVREGLNEESLALFDRLKKPDLEKEDIDAVKDVAEHLLDEIKETLGGVEDWKEKQATRDAVQTRIRDHLWDDRTGLPRCYTKQEVEEKTEEVYMHIFQTYDTANPIIYA